MNILDMTDGELRDLIIKHEGIDAYASRELMRTAKQILEARGQS